MIRSYTAADKADVIRIFQLNTPTYFAVEEQSDLEGFLEAHADNYWLIEQGGQLAGCGGITFSEDKREGRIAWDFFSPNFQGQGLGKQLTLYRLEQIEQVKTVDTIIVRTSQLAYRFYAKFGFITQEIKKDYWAPGLDLYAMAMPVKRK